MKKTIHVHLGDRNSPAGRAAFNRNLADKVLTRDGDDGGRWVTINGAHVHIGEGGKVDKGPPELVNKSEHKAHSHGHRSAAQGHAEAAKGKGKDHPDHAHHNAAAFAHYDAANAHDNADASAERGDIKQARDWHEKAKAHETKAAEHAGKVGSGKAPEPAKFEKPQKHVAMHSEAEDDVRGSEKHEAEHKRLSKLYDGSKADWERNAVNRLIQKNQTEAVQHKAQGLHHQALAAHEHAKQTGSVDDRREALKHIDAAYKAHGKAGGVGSAAKQKELHAMRKEHTPHVEKADKEAAKAPGRERDPGMHPNGTPLRTPGGKAISRPASATPADDAKRRAGQSGGGGSLDAIAARVAKKTAESAADQDPKKKP